MCVVWWETKNYNNFEERRKRERKTNCLYLKKWHAMKEEKKNIIHVAWIRRQNVNLTQSNRIHLCFHCSANSIETQIKLETEIKPGNAIVYYGYSVVSYMNRIQRMHSILRLCLITWNKSFWVRLILFIFWYSYLMRYL